MKRIGFILSLVAMSATVMGQSGKVTNASINVKNGELDKAKAAIEEAILHEKTKEQAKTWMVRGDVYKAIAESKNPAMQALCETPTAIALQSYKKAIELDVKGSLRKQINASLSFMTFAVSNAAYDFNDKGDLANSLDCFEQSLSIDSLTNPTKIDSVTFYNAGLMADKVKNYEKARYYYNKCIEFGYSGALAYGLLANLEKAQGDTAAYLAQIEKGIKAYPNACSSLLVELINHYISQQKSEEALDYLAKAIEQDGKNPTYYLSQGALFDRLGRTDEAKASYDKALEIDPNYFDAWLNLGVQVYNKAYEMLKAANDIPANKQKEYDAAVAAAYEQMNLAVPYFEKAYTINPNDKFLLQDMKECYFRLRGTHPEYNDKYNDIKAKLDAIQ